MEQKLYCCLLLFSKLTVFSPQDRQLVIQIIEALDLCDHSILIIKNLKFISVLVKNLEDYLDPDSGNRNAEQYSSIMKDLKSLSKKLPPKLTQLNPQKGCPNDL